MLKYLDSIQKIIAYCRAICITALRTKIGLSKTIALIIFGSLFIWSPLLAADQNFSLPVPFSSQAPLAQWSDLRQEDGCEEAAAAMAMAWVNSEKLKTKTSWRNEIVAISDFEQKQFGEYRDISVTDIKAWIFKDYFNYDQVAVKTIKSAADILAEIKKGNVVLAPMNGRALKNPYFTAPGPERHMILIKGYDYAAKQFITNDPGTRRGENYRYPAKTVFNAIRAYSTGSKEPFLKNSKQILVVSPKPAKCFQGAEPLR